MINNCLKISTARNLSDNQVAFTSIKKNFKLLEESKDVFIPKKIIVLSGKPRSGKNVLAEMLAKHFPDFKVVDFSQPIINELARIKEVSTDFIYQNKEKFRPNMAEVGNHGRSISPDFWVKKLFAQGEGKDLIITGARDPGEYKSLKGYGAKSIRVEATDEVRRLRRAVPEKENPLESLLDDVKNWDFKIFNNKDKEDFKQASLEIIEKLKEIFQ